MNTQTNMTLLAAQQAAREQRVFNYLIETTSMPIEEILSFVDTFRGWAAGEPFTTGEHFRYGKDSEGLTMLYRSLRTQTAQASIPPDGEHSGSVYECVSHLADGTRIYSRPISSIDAPAIGTIRAQGGVKYRNTIEGNRFAPNEFGWETV